MVNLAGAGEFSAPCNVGSLIVRQLVQLLAGVTSLACSGSLCIRNINFFILCPVCEGGCVALSDLSSNSDDLGCVGLMSSLICIGLIRELAFPLAST